MSNVLLITDRENSTINPPRYVMEEGGVVFLSYYDTRSFVLHAEKGVSYSIASSGNPNLEVIITGPGLKDPLKTTIGGHANFSAPERGVYTVTVQSPEVLNSAVTSVDRPFYGSFSLDVYSNVQDDVGLVQPGAVFTPQVVANFADVIDATTYNLNVAGARVSVKTWDTDTFMINADTGDYYGLVTKGAAGLKVTIKGPGLFVALEDGTKFEVPVEGAVGDALGFRATVGGVYTITVESATARTSVSAEDRPNSGSYSIEVKKSEGEDIDRIEQGTVFTTNNQLKGRIGTASDADQLYGTIPAGASTFVAAYSKDVKDITIEMYEVGGESPVKSASAQNGFALLSFTSPAAATYEMLLRSGSYYQVGDYEAFGGQRLAPGNVLSVGKPKGDTLTFTDATNREVWGWSGSTNISTGSGNDVLVATMDGNDRLSSGAGDDEIYLGGGVDYADGGPGRDVAYFTGIKEFVTFSKSGGNLILTGTLIVSNMPPISSTVTLANIEFVQFFNGMYEVAKDRFLTGIIHFDKPGNNTFTGGKTVETVIFNGDRAQFSVSVSGQQATTIDQGGPGGVNTATGVEKLLFDDVGVQIDFVGVDGKSGTFNEMGTAGRAAAAILTVWGKNALADKQLTGAVIDYFADGADADDAAYILYGTGMLAEAAGGDSNAAVLDYLYKNIVGVAPTKATHDELMKMFDNPEFTQIDLLKLAFDQPVVKQQLVLMGVWGHGLEYIAPPPLDIPA